MGNQCGTPNQDSVRHLGLLNEVQESRRKKQEFRLNDTAEKRLEAQLNTRTPVAEGQEYDDILAFGRLETFWDFSRENNAPDELRQFNEQYERRDSDSSELRLVETHGNKIADIQHNANEALFILSAEKTTPLIGKTKVNDKSVDAAHKAIQEQANLLKTPELKPEAGAYYLKLNSLGLEGEKYFDIKDIM